ncbi:hypothetical protein [Claveliimonas sp.]|uniref:hypothetical protein n=1 Tax=Claveliimonas sp. TaxID=3076672 RepID=UPI00307C2A68
MLDKRKVRLMTKLALYEQKEGREDMKISAYYKKDYISMKTVATILWTTVGYGCVILLIGLAAMNSLLENLTLTTMLVLAAVAVVAYVAALIVTILVTRKISSGKHRDARMRMKRYNHGLIRLLKIYEKENKE